MCHALPSPPQLETEPVTPSPCYVVALRTARRLGVRAGVRSSIRRLVVPACATDDQGQLLVVERPQRLLGQRELLHVNLLSVHSDGGNPQTRALKVGFYPVKRLFKSDSFFMTYLSDDCARRARRSRRRARSREPGRGAEASGRSH